MSTLEQHHYTQDEPIWWHPKNKPSPMRALFILYRKKKVIIDVLQVDGNTLRKVADLRAISPREEERKQEP